jgi:maltooligosyltrehalose trehalohydrolase
VAFVQNHDQVGNPAFGARLAMMVGFEELKLAAGLLLLSPFVPLLFMGEEYGEEAPFPFFASFPDPSLGEAVRRGRIRDFAAFGWIGEPPHPIDEATYQRSKLHHELKASGRHRVLWNLYRELLRLRRETPALAHLSRRDIELRADERQGVLIVRRWSEGEQALAVFNTGEAGASVDVGEAGAWRKRVDSSDERWGGSGTDVADVLDDRLERWLELKPRSFVVFTSGDEEGVRG